MEIAYDSQDFADIVLIVLIVGCKFFAGCSESLKSCKSFDEAVRAAML